MAKIFLDFGHGGHDSGAVGSKTKESTQVLQIGLKLTRLLRASGHTVILTRNNDTFVNLYSRSVKSNVAKADIFVSLHLNSAKSSSANGFETFIFNGKVSNNTIKLQDNIHREILKAFKIRDRGKKRGNFSVLRETVAPAVLIEYGFISNPNEEALIMKNQDVLARATANGINAYFGKKTTAPQNATKPSAPSTNNSATEKEIPLEAWEQRDLKKLFKVAYEEGYFTVDHSEKIGQMSSKEADKLVRAYVARKLIKLKGDK